MNPIIVVTPPTVEPLTADDVQNYLHVSDDEVTLIGYLIQSAREWAEASTGRALCPQVRELVLDRWPNGCGFYPGSAWSNSIIVNCAPIPSIASIKYRDANNAEATWGASEYLADLDSAPARITPQLGRVYPPVVLQPVSGIRVQFPCGYGSDIAPTPPATTVPDATIQALVPGRIKTTMLRWVSWHFDHRDVQQDQLEHRGALVMPEVIELALARDLNDFRIWQF